MRRRVQSDSLRHRCRTGGPLYGIPRVLLRGAELPEPHRQARTDNTWQNYLFAYFHNGRANNGPTAAKDLIIKRAGFGLGVRIFANYRLRLLPTCGTTWRTHRKTRIRERSPRLVS